MDKYEYRAKTEQMLAYAEQKSYQKAMSIADTIDWRKVKNTAMLSTVSEIYENAGELGKRQSKNRLKLLKISSILNTLKNGHMNLPDYTLKLV